MENEEKKPRRPRQQDAHALLLGLGLDGEEGQKRVTVGKNFLLAGGSQPTHELMQEKAIKFNEELDRRKKRLEDLGVAEFHEIAEEIEKRAKS